MAGKITNHDRVKQTLGDSYGAFLDLVRFFRTRYVMDELWNGESELRFYRGETMLSTILIKENAFVCLLVFGKAECGAFDLRRSDFSSYIQEYYDRAKTYHDGKWLFVKIADKTYLSDLYRLLEIKKKSDRMSEMLSGAEVALCGNRCDLCLLYIKNNENNDCSGSREFHELDWDCYHSEPEVRTDYIGRTCPGCKAKAKDSCPEKKCLAQKGLGRCSECGSLAECRINSHDFDPARCNLGISADEITKGVLPYYANERSLRMKEKVE